MKIFHIMKYTLHGAGNVCAAVDLACAQAAQGHEVIICSSVSDFDDLLTQNGVRSIKVNQIGGPQILPLSLWKLLQVLRQERPDVVHAHMMKSAVMSALLRPLLGFRLITTVHNEFQASAILMGVGQRVIGVSEAVSQAMIRRGISRRKVRTVLNGTIDSARRPQPAPAPAALQRPAIVTVGGMHPRKGIPDLIAAYGLVAAEFPQAHLYLIGSGPEGEAYRRLAAETSPGGITFLGHMDDPRPVMLGADIFVLASHAEPAGLVLSEAREAGCAVIATNVGGIPEMLDQGRAGVLVAPQRPDLLAKAITKFLKDPSYLNEMRSKAQVGLERFSMQRVWRETEGVYMELFRPQREGKAAHTSPGGQMASSVRE